MAKQIRGFSHGSVEIRVMPSADGLIEIMMDDGDCELSVNLAAVEISLFAEMLQQAEAESRPKKAPQ
jgi:hypothetical protein